MWCYLGSMSWGILWPTRWLSFFLEAINMNFNKERKRKKGKKKQKTRQEKKLVTINPEIHNQRWLSFI